MCANLNVSTDSSLFHCVVKQGSGGWFPTVRRPKVPAQMYSIINGELCSVRRRTGTARELPLVV